MKKIERGFFMAEDSAHVDKQPLDSAKAYMLNRIVHYVELHPQTEQKNVDEITAKINACTSSSKLTRLLWDLILAHPSENLKVIK